MLQALTLAALLSNPQVERPRDIWVFRSVLDKHARMLTIELHKDLYVAYDATYCGLYQAWTGGVKLDGSVYTTVHGPQPTSEGQPYIHNDPEKNTWSIVSGGRRTEVKPTFKGYRLLNNQVRLQVDFKLPTGRTATVYETPEVVPGGKNVSLTRTFVTQGLPANTTLAVEMNYRSADLVRQPETNGQWFSDSTSAEWRGGTLYLVPNGTTNSTFTFKKLSMEAVAIANTPTRDLIAPKPEPTVQQDQSSQREPGLAHRLYFLGVELTEMPRLVPGQTPNYSVVVPNVDLKEGDFGAFPEYTINDVSGFLTAPADGQYEFRLFSDDGATLAFNGTVVVENKGQRGMGDTPGAATVTLKKGENPIEILMFQNAGGIGLRLEWKKPGDSNWSVVPTEAFSTPKGEVRVTAPGKKRIFGQLLTRPGDGQWLDGVHPSFTLSQARPAGFHPKVGGIDFLPNGDMVICAWEPDGGVYQISGWDGPEERIKVKRIAFGLAEPLGVKVVDGKIFVLQKQELTQLVDNDKDGLTDEYRCIANGWGVTNNFHEFAFGLAYNNGKFYGNLATAINPGGSSYYPQNMDRGRSIEINPKDGSYRFITKGLRTPNGIGWGAKGQLYISDNQGDWLPSSKILLLKEGAFYGNRSVDPTGTKDLKEDPPVVWLPQNEIGNSPSSIAPLNVGPYKDQMVHGDVTHGGLKRVFVEVVDGIYQGVVFRMTQGLESGVNRVMRAPDGSYITGGVGSSGNWGQIGKLPYGLQRLTFNGKSTFEMLEVHAKSNGMEVVFTEPVAAGMGDTPDFWKVGQWRYVPTVEYGGPKVDEENLNVKSVTVSKDRKSVFLEIEGLKAGHVVFLHAHPALQNPTGQPIWTTEAWYTLNRIPNARGTVRPSTSAMPSPLMSAEESTEGFEQLFGGADLSKFTGWKQDAPTANWTLSEGSLVMDPSQPGTDLVTKDKFGDFDLRWSWRMTKGGNSGVIYRVGADHKNTYETGPEYQLLDNAEHPDGKNPFTMAGSFYALYEPSADVTMPIGFWNESRIVAKGHIIEHWMNGTLMCRVDMASDEYKYKVSKSKFNKMPDYGTLMEGFIAFQNHGNAMAFRNIRIKRM